MFFRKSIYEVLLSPTALFLFHSFSPESCLLAWTHLSTWSLVWLSKAATTSEMKTSAFSSSVFIADSRSAAIDWRPDRTMRLTYSRASLVFFVAPSKESPRSLLLTQTRQQFGDHHCVNIIFKWNKNLNKVYMINWGPVSAVFFLGFGYLCGWAISSKLRHICSQDIKTDDIGRKTISPPVHELACPKTAAVNDQLVMVYQPRGKVCGECCSTDFWRGIHNI